MRDVWKIIDEFPSFGVSNLGRVRGSSGTILRRRLKGSAWVVSLEREDGHRKSVAVKRLVANAFLPRGAGRVVHLDGDPANCAARNLELRTVEQRVASRFWRRVSRGGPRECWPWTGKFWPDGYGKFSGPETRAPRMAWVLENGPIRGGLWVLHECDNPPCCNPRHLFLGTPKDNSRDRERKGRGRDQRGSKNSMARLTEKQVGKMAKSWSRGVSCRDLAREFGVSPATVSLVVHGKVWGHLSRIRRPRTCRGGWHDRCWRDARHVARCLKASPSARKFFARHRAWPRWVRGT